MGSNAQGVPSLIIQRGDLVKIIETDQICKVSGTDHVGVYVWENGVEHGKYCFMTDIERVTLETITFNGATLTRRVINASRIDAMEYGLIVYNCRFYRVTRPIDSTTTWQVVSAL